MARKRHSAEQVIRMLRDAEASLAEGSSVKEVCAQLEITERTFYRWRKEYGGMRLDQAQRLKELERENARLRRVVADQALDNAILREHVSGA